MSLQEIYAQYLSPLDAQTLQGLSSDAASSSIATLLNQVILGVWQDRSRLVSSNDRLVAELRTLSADNHQLHDQLIQEKKDKNEQLTLLNQKYRELLSMKENLVKLVEEKMELPVPDSEKEVPDAALHTNPPQESKNDPLSSTISEPELRGEASKIEAPKLDILHDKISQLELELNLSKNELRRNRLFLMRALELSFPMRDSLSTQANANHAFNSTALLTATRPTGPATPPDSLLSATESSLRELARELTYENQILQELLLDDHRKMTSLQEQIQSQTLYSKQAASLKSENERLTAQSASLQERLSAMERSMLGSVSTSSGDQGPSSQQHLYEMIQKLTQKRQSQDQELQKLQAKVGTLSSQLYAAENQVSLYVAQLKTLHMQLDALPPSVAPSTANQGSERWQVKCQQIWNAYDSTSAAFLSLQSQYTSLLSHIQSQDDMIARLESSVAEYETRIIPLQYDHQRLASLEQEWADEKSELLKCLSAYIEKLAQAETNLSTAQDTTAHLRNENEGLKRAAAQRQASPYDSEANVQDSKACLREFQALNHSLYLKIESQRKRIVEMEQELQMKERYLVEQSAKVSRLESEQASLKDMIFGLERILESTRDEGMASQRVPSPIPPVKHPTMARQSPVHEHEQMPHLGFDDSPEQRIYPVQGDYSVDTKSLLEEWRSGSQSILEDLAAIRTRRKELSSSASLDSLQKVQLMIQEENVLLRHIVNQIKDNLHAEAPTEEQEKDTKKPSTSYKEQTTF